MGGCDSCGSGSWGPLHRPPPQRGLPDSGHTHSSLSTCPSSLFFYLSLPLPTFCLPRSISPFYLSICFCLSLSLPSLSHLTVHSPRPFPHPSLHPSQSISPFHPHLLSHIHLSPSACLSPHLSLQTVSVSDLAAPTYLLSLSLSPIPKSLYAAWLYLLSFYLQLPFSYFTPYVYLPLSRTLPSACPKTRAPGAPRSAVEGTLLPPAPSSLPVSVALSAGPLSPAAVSPPPGPSPPPPVTRSGVP